MYNQNIICDENNKFLYICPVCHKEYWLSKNTYEKKISNNEKCSSCIRSEKTTKQMIERWKSDEYRKQHSERASKQMKEFWNSKNPDDIQVKDKLIKNLHDGRDKFFKDGNIEQLAERSKKISEKLSGNNNAHWHSMSKEDQLKKISVLNESKKLYYENLSEEDKIKHRKILSDAQKKLWNNISAEEHEKRKEFLCQIHKDWINNMTPEEYEQNSEKHMIISTKYWESLSDEEKLNKISKSISGNKITGLNTKFEKLFNNSHLSNNYYFKPEIITTNNSITHSWDYAIYNKSNNMLEMVVDLDGEFYHADKCDYNGTHSREEYDEIRSQSINGNIKYIIINEANFIKCFDLMIKMLLMNYDEYVQYIFNMCRNMPFPYPHYTDIELIKSYNDLCKMNCNDKYHQDISLNTRIGDRLIQHFHYSIYHAHCKNCISPYESWHNDEMLLKVIQNRIIYQTYLNPNKILQGFNICKIAPKVSVFSAGRAKLIINKYLSEYDTIFDLFSGFSGRMLGTISLGKKYIGQDISLEHVNESNDIIKFLTKYFDVNAIVSQKDIMDSYGEYSCLFTCSPYSNKEQWLDVSVSMNSCDDWIDICLEHFKCKRYVFIVDNTEKYKNYIVYDLTNKSHFSKNNEYLILIEGGKSN